MAINFLDRLGIEATTTPTGAVQLVTTMTVGQPIVVLLSSGTLTGQYVYDSNGNVYTLLNSWNAGGGNCMSIYFTRTNSTTPPLITKSGGTNSWKMQCDSFSGFTGVATFDPLLTAHWDSGAGQTNINFTPIITNFANEVLILSYHCGHVPTALPSGWLDAAPGATSLDGFFQILPTAGTQNDFSCTLTGADDMFALLVGLYDSPAPAGALFGVI